MPTLAAAGLLEGRRGLGGRVYATQGWRRAGERPTCLYNSRANSSTMFIVAVRTQEPAGEVIPRQVSAERVGGVEGDNPRHDGSARTDGEAGAGGAAGGTGDAGGSEGRKRAPPGEDDARRTRGATHAGGGDDDGDDTGGDDEMQSGQDMDEEDTREVATTTAAQLEQAASPEAGTSMWDGARTRTGRAIGGAVSAVGGMLRRASSWWRKRQREADDDGPDETRKRTKGDG